MHTHMYFPIEWLLGDRKSAEKERQEDCPKHKRMSIICRQRQP